MESYELTVPPEDPHWIYDIFDANFGNKILVAAATHFNVFLHLKYENLTHEELKKRLELSHDRPMMVLMTALRAFKLVEKDDQGRYAMSSAGRTFLTPGSPFNVTDYLELAVDARGVIDLVEGMRTNTPAESRAGGKGAAYVKSEGVKSAMDDPKDARWLTERLAGRAANTAARLAELVSLDGARLLVDVGGGTGIFSFAFLQKYPELRAEIVELSMVAREAENNARRYGVGDRAKCVIRNMFTEPLPQGADAILLSNVLHDWDVGKSCDLVKKCADALRPGGKLIIHDVLLNDELSGPRTIAIYSVVLFYLTEGRAYSKREYKDWLEKAGLVPQEPVKTLVNCWAITAVKK